MDCDGLKKMIVEDLDGTFLGTKGTTVLPESEWQWDWPGGEPNVDRRRGLGDYRIPKPMLTDLSGNRIPVESIAHDRGMIKILLPTSNVIKSTKVFGKRSANFGHGFLSAHRSYGRD